MRPVTAASVALLCALFGASSALGRQPLKNHQDRVTRLDGAPVVVIERPWPPLVHLQLEIDAGSLHDPANHEGLATLCWRTALKASRGRDRQALTAALEALGSEVSVHVGRETAYVELSALADSFDESLALLAETLKEPRFDEDDLRRERVLLEAERLAQANEPDSLADEALFRFTFRALPAGRARAGSKASLARVKSDQCVRWHRTAMAEAPVRIGVSGPLKPARVLGALQTRLSSLLVDKPRKPALRLPRPSIKGRRLLLIDMPGQPQATLALALSSVGAKDPLSAAMEVVDACLGGMFTSRLNQRIREQRGWAYSLESELSQGPAHGLWSVMWSTEPQVAARSLDLAMRVIELATRDGFRDKEVAQGVGYLTGQARMARDTPQGHLRWIMEHWRRDAKSDRTQLNGLNGAVVSTAAKSLLHPADVVAVVVGDAERLRPLLSNAASGFSIEVQRPSDQPDLARVVGARVKETAGPQIKASKPKAADAAGDRQASESDADASGSK